MSFFLLPAVQTAEFKAASVCVPRVLTVRSFRILSDLKRTLGRDEADDSPFSGRGELARVRDLATADRPNL